MNIPQQTTLENYSQKMGGDRDALPLSFQNRGLTDIESWQAGLRDELSRLLGLDRIASCRVDSQEAILVGQVSEKDHLREDWLIQTERDYYVPVFVLKPIIKNKNQRLPVVLTPHGHNEQGRYIYAGIATTPQEENEISEGQRDIALQSVRQGYLTIVPEARAFGESRGQKAKDAGFKFVCDQWQHRAQLYGRTLLGERVWDIMRLIDWAKTRDDTDVSKIAITGNSGGGTVSLFAAAIDRRINVCVPGSSFCTLTDSIAAIHHCACNYVPGILSCAEMSDVAALIAPRAFLAVHGKNDRIFPIQATRHAMELLKKVYWELGVPEYCELYVGDGGHRFYSEPVWKFIHTFFMSIQ